MTLSEVLSAQAEIELAKKRANHAEDEFCNEHCPVKIGDVVTIAGYSHRGKTDARYKSSTLQIQHGKIQLFFCIWRCA